MDSIEKRTSAKAAMPEDSVVRHRLSFEGGIDLPGVLQFEW